MKIRERATSYQTEPQKFTYQDYLSLPDDGNRYEIIAGEMIMVAAPNPYHQKISWNLILLIGIFLKNNKIGNAFGAPIDVLLDEKNVVQPDILFILNEHAEIIKEKYIEGAPDLVIEILSETTAYRDLVDKKELYAWFGVNEFWLVDPKKQRVEIFENIDGEFVLKQREEKSGFVKSKLLSGLEVSLDDIFLAD